MPWHHGTLRLFQGWKRWAQMVKLETFTLYYAYRNPRTPWYAKIWGALVVAYAFSPIDLIPDFIPVLGYLDDFILIPLGIAIARKLIPEDVLTESRARARDRVGQSRPVNWLVGGIVIFIWIAAAILIVRAIVRRIRAH